jgi:hypothetical protein
MAERKEELLARARKPPELPEPLEPTD